MKNGIITRTLATTFSASLKYLKLTGNVVSQIRRIRIRIITVRAIEFPVVGSFLGVVGIENPKDFAKGGARVEVVVSFPNRPGIIRVRNVATCINVD